MKKDDFKIGEPFYTGSGKWICTDIGTRVIVAVKTGEDAAKECGGGPSGVALREGRLPVGPPYCVGEYVFDEYDVGGCSTEPKTSQENLRLSVQVGPERARFHDMGPEPVLAEPLTDAEREEIADLIASKRKSKEVK